MEIAILMWFVIAAGIAAGAFVIARSAIQIASVAYSVLEKRLDPRVATRQTIALTLAAIAAFVATSIIAYRDPRDAAGSGGRERPESVGHEEAPADRRRFVVSGCSRGQIVFGVSGCGDGRGVRG